MKRQLIILALTGVLNGCKYAEVDEPKMSAALADYLELCRDTAVGGKLEGDDREDWMVGSGATSWERNATYKLVYADERYLSFRAEEFEYNGGAHGSTKITVGTFDRRTGKLLKAADLIPAARRAEVLKALRAGVVKAIGGEDQLQGEVRIINNCFVAKDGIHFVYNEYEVACYAAGSIEVVVKI